MREATARRAPALGTPRARIVVALVAIAGALVWIAVSGISHNLVYYQTPTEVLRSGSSIVGEPTRLGGLVLPGTVRTTARGVQFVVSDETSRMSVLATGGVPSMFAAGRGVVVEGFYGRDGVFHADTVLAKHGDQYRPPAPGETPTSADLGG
jgi:cytochrome c-type biogenesis protein CcmE